VTASGEKETRYRELVRERRCCRLCENLVNPADPSISKFDSDEIGPWSRWQGSLSPELLVVGQDWGDVDYYVARRGREETAGNPTNDNLARLLNSIGFECGSPGSNAPDSRLFFTNLVLCLKSGGLQAPVEAGWFTNCTREFFAELLDILRPTVVVALGLRPTRAILAHFEIEAAPGGRLSDLVEGGPYRIPDSSSVLFPVFHCGARGVNQNRSFESQVRDWARIEAWLLAEGAS